MPPRPLSSMKKNDRVKIIPKEQNVNFEPGADRKLNDKEMSLEDACSVFQDYDEMVDDNGIVIENHKN